MRLQQCTMLLKRIKRMLLVLVLAAIGCADVIKVYNMLLCFRKLVDVVHAQPPNLCDTTHPGVHIHMVSTHTHAQLAPCTNSLLVDIYRDPNVTFASTMLRGGNPPPQLVFADKQRETDALNALLATADPTAINGSFSPITMFISDNTGFVRSLSGMWVLWWW